MAIGAGNTPIISYYDGSVLKVAYCILGCTVLNTTAVTAPNVGLYNSMVVSSGLPVISYYDANTQDLILSRCS